MFQSYLLNVINMWICSLGSPMLIHIRHTLSSPILQYWLTLCFRLWWVGCGGEGDLSREGRWCWRHYCCVIARLHSLQDLPTTGTEHRVTFSETVWKMSKQPVIIIVLECFRTILVFNILKISQEWCWKCKKRVIFLNSTVHTMYYWRVKAIDYILVYIT